MISKLIGNRHLFLSLVEPSSLLHGQQYLSPATALTTPHQAHILSILKRMARRQTTAFYFVQEDHIPLATGSWIMSLLWHIFYSAHLIPSAMTPINSAMTPIQLPRILSGFSILCNSFSILRTSSGTISWPSRISFHALEDNCSLRFLLQFQQFLQQ